MARIPKAYLEKAGDEWLDDFVYISRDPLVRRGYKIVPFDGSDLEGNLLNKPINFEEDVIIGSVEALTAAFNEGGIIIPDVLSYPEELKGYLGREVTKTTFGALGEDFPYFTKPASQVKLFTGEVISTKSNLRFLEAYNLVRPETEVYKSDLINFESEFRCFVTHGELRGIQYYTGDFELYPNTFRIHEMIMAYKNCPSAYTLDVGVADDGETYLVEVNDMWAIGSYGFNAEHYALMCARRFREIVTNSNKIKAQAEK